MVRPKPEQNDTDGESNGRCPIDPAWTQAQKHYHDVSDVWKS